MSSFSIQSMRGFCLVSLSLFHVSNMLPILLGPSMRAVRWYSKISLFAPGPAVGAMKKISGEFLSLDLDLEPTRRGNGATFPSSHRRSGSCRVGMLRGPRSSTTAEPS